MLKFFIILISVNLMFISKAFSNLDSKVLKFNRWLNLNGYDQYLDKTGDPVDILYDRSLCKPTITWRCFGADGKIILDKDRKSTPIYPNNLKLKLNRKKNNIAFQQNPNRDTLIYYLWNAAFRNVDNYEIKPSTKPYEFKFNLIDDQFVKKQMKTKGIMSYLYFQEGQILIDEISPKEQMGEFINNETKFYSMSMGKSITSYILGHAICGGYIDGVDARINDWPPIENTLYHNQKLIDFLNMSTGDQKYIDEFIKNDGTFIEGPSHKYENESIARSTNLFFQGSVKTKSRYYYNGFMTQIITNYTKYKTGDDYNKLLKEIFVDKVKIKYSIFPTYSNSDAPEESGILHPNLRVSRYDWLRIAKAMMDDYQNDTCVGKYLKEIHKRRVPKNLNKKHMSEPHYNRTKSYGGQFHFDYPELKDKAVFGMGGYGGRAILIDMENSRIVVLNSLHYNHDKFKYNHKKLLIDPIKNGK